ncbi:MAG: gamma-glutamylcyclotransferase [Gammaproteobacteria bacterium]|nr:gamma-glutamylcyclotransferase [Gammaproteobacteria bacterium]MBI5615003.1 gamma-glutamylcyclotransferase [Gammaproteobacteria bacterium]
MSLRYLAYGSNLHPGRLGARIAIEGFLGTTALPGWRLTFDKRGADGSAKCDLKHTGMAGDCAWGAVYALDPAAKATLDAIEGLGKGYGERELIVPELGAVALYVASGSALDPTLVPFDWYREIVVAGARHHGFPASYVASIAAVAACRDPDAERAAKHRELLASLRA